MPEINGPLPAGSDFHPDPSGPTFEEALRDHLGIKLESEKSPLKVLVFDHVERPSEN
jgi:bla regulator protein BlaR1